MAVQYLRDTSAVVENASSFVYNTTIRYHCAIEYIVLKKKPYAFLQMIVHPLILCSVTKQQ